MTDKEIQKAIGRLKLERAEFYEMKGKIISQWKLKTFLNGAEINLGKRIHKSERNP